MQMYKELKIQLRKIILAFIWGFSINLLLILPYIFITVYTGKEWEFYNKVLNKYHKIVKF